RVVAGRMRRSYDPQTLNEAVLALRLNVRQTNALTGWLDAARAELPDASDLDIVFRAQENLRRAIEAEQAWWLERARRDRWNAERQRRRAEARRKVQQAI